MSSLESDGFGLGGRTDGPLFDARHILMPASLVFGSIGEALQVDKERLETLGKPVPHDNGFVGEMIHGLANNPLDNKALGLAFATAFTAQVIHSVKARRNIAIENTLLVSGIHRKSAVEPVHTRAIKRLTTLGISVAAGYGAYKVGENLSTVTDIVADASIIGAGVVYLEVMQKRLTGHW
jgi:hypothetical protein